MRQAVVGLVSAFTLVGLLGVAGARVNTTASFPVGLYWRIDRPAGKGDLVLFCPPREPVFSEALARGYLSPGFCPAGSGALIKRVVAVAGDRITIGPTGTRINGMPLPNSGQRRTDLMGRPLPDFRVDKILRAGDVLLMSDQHGASFDGRYFGPVAATHLRGVVVPVWVFGREAAR